jgi:hypothetical protein
MIEQECSVAKLLYHWSMTGSEGLETGAKAVQF